MDVQAVHRPRVVGSEKKNDAMSTGRISAFTPARRHLAVSTEPGLAQLTRIPCLPTSRPMPLEAPVTVPMRPSKRPITAGIVERQQSQPPGGACPIKAAGRRQAAFSRI
jgi:hypothetical protein